MVGQEDAYIILPVTLHKLEPGEKMDRYLNWSCPTGHQSLVGGSELAGRVEETSPFGTARRVSGSEAGVHPGQSASSCGYVRDCIAAMCPSRPCPAVHRSAVRPVSRDGIRNVHDMPVNHGRSS